MIIELCGKKLEIDRGTFIAENSMVIGDVEIGPGTNIWFQCVVRGDTNHIRIGSNCNIQDSCVLHVVKGLHPVILEDEVGCWAIAWWPMDA